MSKNKFDIVTPEWVRSQMKENRVSNKLLAEEINTTSPKISQWLGGSPMSNPAKAAMFHYFKQL